MRTMKNASTLHITLWNILWIFLFTHLENLWVNFSYFFYSIDSIFHTFFSLIFPHMDISYIQQSLWKIVYVRMIIIKHSPFTSIALNSSSLAVNLLSKYTYIVCVLKLRVACSIRCLCAMWLLHVLFKLSVTNFVRFPATCLSINIWVDLFCTCECLHCSLMNLRTKFFLLTNALLLDFSHAASKKICRLHAIFILERKLGFFNPCMFLTTNNDLEIHNWQSFLMSIIIWALSFFVCSQKFIWWKTKQQSDKGRSGFIMRLLSFRLVWA